MATKQTTLDWNVRKKSSRIQASSKYQSEKENEVCCDSPSRRSLRANRGRVAPIPSYCSDSEGENDEILPIQTSPSKLCSPSKRKIQLSQGHASPPKVACQSEEKAQATPSTRLTNLTLDSPESKPAPKHSQTTLKFKKDLFAAKEDPADTDFRKARQAFHTSSTDSLPGREKELAELKDFFLNHINNGTSGSIYISGPPGTGKTASLTHLMNQKEIKGCFQTVYINCTSIKSPGALYSHIVSQLGLKVRGRPSEKSSLAALEKYFSSKRKMLLFVLDEMDQLESRGQSVLYTVFEWPVTHPQGVVLVGIANALDLTDRTLPRLRAREDLAPKLLHFAPYSRQQLVNILKLRLEEAGVGDVFSAPALQMLASKVAAVSGDVRRALDIGRRVIEISGNPFRGNPQAVATHAGLKTEKQTPQSPTKMPLGLRSPNKCVPPVLLSPTKHQLLSPKKEQPSPKREPFSPKREPFSPKRELFSPKRELFSAKTELRSPKRELFSPKRELRSPKREPFSPKRELFSPKRELFSPKRELFSPKREQQSPLKTASPSKQSVASKSWTSPRKQFLSPTKTVQLATAAATSPRRSSPRKLFQSPARTAVDVKGVLSVVNEVYNSSQSVGHGADELPLQQRLAVCSLMLILKNAKSKDVTVAKLHDVYRRVCNKRKFEPLDQSSFLGMLGLVEARGLLAIQGRGQPSRLSKVCLKWVEDEVVAALRDRDLLASILSDVACLS